MKNLLLLFGAFSVMLLSQTSFGQACLTDNGSAAVYSPSWDAGDNGGAGFTGWTRSTTSGDGGQNGFFMANSNGNGGTTNIGNPAWGFYANSGQTASAVRPFASSLAIGRSITFSIDNGTITGTVGMGLQNASNQNLMELYFVGGDSRYTLNDASVTTTTIDYTNGGITVKVTRKTTSTYDIEITRLDGAGGGGGTASQTLTARTFKTPGSGTQDPAQIRFFNFNAGSGGGANFYANNLSICTPTITPATNTFTAFTTTYGTVSTAQTVGVTATNLIADITATAATNFEVSNGGAYGASTTFTQSGGSASGTLSVRLKANAPVAGSYNSITAVTLTSTGATSRTYTTAASGNAVSPATITITADNQNVPYGTAAATVTGAGSYTPTGFQNGENSGVISGSATYTTTYTNTTPAGTAGVTITPVVTGLTAANYNFSPANGSITITGVNQTTANYRSKQVGDGNFGTAANWEYDGGGGGYVQATLAPGAGNNIDVRHSLTLNTLFTIGAGKTLKVSAGTLDLNGQAVTIKSTGAGTGAIGRIESGAAITGATNVTVERFIPATGQKWRLLAAPTTGTQTIRQAWMNLTNGQAGYVTGTPTINDAGVGTIISSGYAALVGNGNMAQGGFDAQSQTTSIKYYDSATNAFRYYDNVNAPVSSDSGRWNSGLATKYNPGGYFLFIRGDRTKGVNSGGTTSTTLRSNGGIKTGPDLVRAVKNGQFKLIANPYPCEINFTRIALTGGVSNTLYLWDALKGANGGYETFSSPGFAAVVGGGSWGSGVVDTLIQSGQAFFVSAPSVSGTVAITQNSKVYANSGSNNLALRPAAPAQDSRLSTRLLVGDKVYDGNAVVFSKDYSNDINADDALKLTNPGEDFAITSQGKALAVETRQPVSGEDVISFTMKNMKQQAYSLEFKASNMGTGEAYLVDNYLNTRTAISLTQVTKVKFSVTVDTKSAAADRFKVVFRPAAVTVEGKPAIRVSPNPVETGIMNVQFTQQAKGKYSIKLVDLSGRTLFETRRVHAGGSANQAVTIPSGIARGAYHVVITAANKTRQVQKVFINTNK